MATAPTGLRLKARQGAGGVMAIAGTASLTASASLASASALTWSGDPFPLTVVRGGSTSLEPYISDPNDELGDITANVTLPTGVTISGPPWQINAAVDATLGDTSSVNLTLVKTKRADFNARAAGSRVVWWHAFDSAAEVNQFRWSSTIGSNPDAVGDGARCQWIATGGPSGGGYVRNLRGPGTTGDNTYWQRPFNPLTGATNGKGVDDPGDGGAIPRVAFSVTQGVDAQFNWAGTSRPGWYGHSSYHSGTQFDGTDFYLQIRVRRGTTGGSTGAGITGKNVWFSTTTFSYTVQELVTYGNSELTQTGVYDPFNIYQGFNYENVYTVCTTPTPDGTRIQRGSELVGVCDWYNNNVPGCWFYSGGWDTLLYHITPGLDGVTGTQLEVWAQHDLDLYPAEAGVYKKITDVIYPAHFEASLQKGWNALLFGMYHNGASMPEFFQDYGDPIFSKAFIAAPTV